MITFQKHNTSDCLQCYETETALQNMVVAHECLQLPPGRNNTPFILEGNKKIIGHPAIKSYTEELQETMELWRMYQSDACYIDSHGKVC